MSNKVQWNIPTVVELICSFCNQKSLLDMNYAKTPKDTLLNVLYILWTFSDIWLVLLIIWWGFFPNWNKWGNFQSNVLHLRKLHWRQKVKTREGGRLIHFFSFFFFWGTLFNSNWEWVNRKKLLLFANIKIVCVLQNGC